MKDKNVCGVTVPTETGYIEETMEILKLWGADAVRDCDGTTMPQEIIDAGLKVYSTYFVARGDNEWAKAHLDESTHFYLLSNRALSLGKTVEIDFLDGYLREQVVAEYGYDVKKWWEVIDRTENEIVPKSNWVVDPAKNIVTVKNTTPYHEYTVSFLAKATWDTTQMYNYITNNWTRDKDLPFDAHFPNTNEYVVTKLNKWLDEHPDTDVVRFTTFFYHFTILFNSHRKEKFVDWFGYSGSVSPIALDNFEKEYGYRLRPEDIIDEGYYNSPFRVPTQEFLDYMDYTQRFVAKNAKRLVDSVHARGKEAMMFLGDNWIGTEPYGKYFASIGLDAVVGSVGGGVTVRMLSDMPNLKYVEGRFLPYFFPDTFYDGNDPTIELDKNWLTARRAIMRKPIDRIGYGGYLSLAGKFPKFVARVGEITAEFKNIYNKVRGEKPYSAVKVAILNSWGYLRSWQCFMVAHELWYKDIYSYQGILEALSGMATDVSFINFDDVRDGALKKYDVVINCGGAGTAFSGGDNWLDPTLIATINEWIYSGGGFIGIGEPSAVQSGGRFFQLASALGVDKECGFSMSTDRYNVSKVNKHFILQDVTSPIDYGEGMKSIYAYDDTEILDFSDNSPVKRNVNVGEVYMATHNFGKGRCFYMAGMPYSQQNARILYRALYYVANKESEIYKAFSSNPSVECSCYNGEYALVNNSEASQKTTFYNLLGEAKEVSLAPMEIKWLQE